MAADPMTCTEAWSVLETAIKRLIELDDVPQQEPLFTPEEYINCYTTVYRVCQTELEWEHLHVQYRVTVTEYIRSKVLPSLRGKENEELFREISKRWNLHKIMIKYLGRFLDYFSRNYLPRIGESSLEEMAHTIFCRSVHEEFKEQIMRAIIYFITRERDGIEIDRAMIKKVEDICDGALLKNVEEAVIEATAVYYSSKSLEWLGDQSYITYMLKVEECIPQEEKRFSDIFNFVSKERVVKAVERELLDVHEKKLLWELTDSPLGKQAI